MGLNQKLAGSIEPNSESWRSAKAADRLAFYKQAGDVAVSIKRDELSRGIGANGRKMKPRKRPRPDGANGPVLTPHDEKSRTSRLMASRATSSGVTLYWHAGIRKGQKTAWGTILGFHAAGDGHLPVRDVRLSKRGVGLVRKAMETWWEERLKARARKARKAEPSKPGLIERFKGAVKGVVDAARRKFTAPSSASHDAIRREQARLKKQYPGLGRYFRDPGEKG